MYIYPLKAAHGDALIIRFLAKTSLRTLLPQDENGNAKVGKDIRLYDCKNCVVLTADETRSAFGLPAKGRTKNQRVR